MSQLEISALTNKAKEANLALHYLVQAKDFCWKAEETTLQDAAERISGAIESIRQCKAFEAKKSHVCAWCGWKNYCQKKGQ